jgi:hypothetical protein
MVLLQTGRASACRATRENRDVSNDAAQKAPPVSVRRATQVQARTQHIAAGAGQFDLWLEVTHVQI